MKKRYIDFVPAKKGAAAKKPVVKKPVAKKPVKRVVKRIPAANPLLDEEVVVEEIFAERELPAGVSKGGAKLGTIENVQPKFVKTEVKKRPLGKKPAAKVAKPAAKTAAKPAVKTTLKAAPKKAAPLGQRAKFINADKIQKRPLSKSTAPRKPVIVPKIEKPSAPERIISKPEKDSKAGLISAIILTIILGAAAGTVAFLLLPK